MALLFNASFREVCEQATKQRVGAFAAAAIFLGLPTCDPSVKYSTHPELPAVTIHLLPGRRIDLLQLVDSFAHGT